MLADLRGAFSFLTIVPLGYDSGRKPGWSFTWYPLVGLVIGCALFGVAYLSPFSQPVTAFLVLLTWVVITGGLHLDGFGDSCDGLLASVEPARRMEIMRDSRAGSWAVVGLFLLLLGKWTFITETQALPLILPPIFGRWVMVLAAWRFNYAREAGLGGLFRDGLGWQQAVSASVMALAFSLLAVRQIMPVLVSMVVSLCVLYAVGYWAARQLKGGITGDVYGALCELTELSCLFGLLGYATWVNG